MAKISKTKGLLISLISLAVFFPLLEFALQKGGFVYPPKDEPLTIWNRIEDRDLRLGGGLHKTVAGELWAPRPNADIPIEWCTGEKVNADGYRGPLRPKEKTPGVLRIATMGDSSTFGFGLCYPACYSAQLEELLKSRGVSCEVLDFGVIGYTVRQGFERYTRVVRQYKPDIVVEAFGAVNDHHQAQVMADKDKIKVDVEAQGWWLETKTWIRANCRVVHLLAKTADMLRGGYYDERDRAFKKVRFEEKISAKMGEVDFETKYHGTRRVSLEDFKATMLALENEVKQDGARLVMLNMPRLKNVEEQSPVLLLYSRLVLEIAVSEGLPLADGRKAFAEALKSGAREQRLYVKGDSYHPSQDGHALLAAALAEQIQGLVPAK